MKIKVLLIGCGEHSTENLLPSLAGISSVQVCGLAEPNDQALNAALRWFPSAERIQHDQIDVNSISRFDAVVVAATPQVHVASARAAIQATIPIFVEKPPAITTAELRELATASQLAGVTTCVGHNLRHSDAAIQFHNIIDSTQFGTPSAMEMRYMASKPRGMRWGLDSTLRSFLLSHANHAIDLMIYQMGEIKQVVAARATPDVAGGIAISAQFVFSSGAIGNLLATSYAPHFTLAATVVSDRGSIATLNGLSEVRVTGRHELGKRWSDRWEPRTLETGYRYAGYQTELERFFVACHNKTPHAIHPSFGDEVVVYDTMDRIEQSIRDGGEFA